MKTLTLGGETFEVTDEVARNEIKKLKEEGSGGVQPDLAQNDETAPDYVKNRTHYEAEELVNAPLHITWDGNTEGLVCAVGFPYYKVSDAVLTDEQIKSVLVTLGQEYTYPLLEEWDTLVSNGNVTEDLVWGSSVAFVRKSDVEINGFPEVGIYFPAFEGMYTSAITTTEPVEQTKTVVHKLDSKYLPDDIGGGVFKVNVSYDNANSEWVCDKTYDEIKAAENAKIPIVGTFTNRAGQVFTCIGCDIAVPCCYLAAFDVSSSSELFIYKIVVEENKASVVGLTLTATPTEV